MPTNELKTQIKAIPQATGYTLSTTIPAPELPQHAGALSPEMQSIARNYLGARARAGEAILDAARYLAEARQAAKRGEWGIFLEATGTAEDTAARMLAIASRASTDQQYARAISDGRLAFTAAFELLNAPEETQQRALESAEPTPVSAIRADKQAEKLRNVAEFRSESFWQALTKNHPTAHLWTQERPDLYRTACGMVIQNRAPAGSLEGGHCSSCVRATWTQREAAPVESDDHPLMIDSLSDIQASPAPVETDDQAIKAEIRTLAADHGLELVWEDGKVLLFWPGENIDQYDPMRYDRAIEWLNEDAARLRPAQQPAPIIDLEVEQEIKRLCAISGSKYLGVPDLPYPTATRYRIAKFSGGGGDYLADEALAELRIECDKRSQAALEQIASSDRASYETQERADQAIIADVTRLLAQARQLLGTVKFATWQAAPIEQAVTREQARAFAADQRDRLTRFSEHAMVSQTTFKQALDHIEALITEQR